MAINIGYEPAGLSALAALVLGEAARADAEQRRGEAQGGANMQTALAALNANADRGAGNMLARGYSGGQLINLGGGGGGGSAEGTSARIAREIGGVNSTPQERAGIQADILAGRDPNGTGGGSRRSGGNGAAPISSVQGSLAEAQAYDFDRTPQSVRRALYSPEDAASIDRIQTQVGGYQDLERLQQEGRVEIQGLISDRQNMKMGMPTRADEVRRAQLNSQIRQLEMDDTVPDDVKAPAIQHLQNEAKKIPTSAPLDWQNDIETYVKEVPGLGVLIRKNSPVEFARNAGKGPAVATPQQIQAARKEIAKEYKDEGEAILDELNQNIEDQASLLEEIDTIEDPKQLVAKQQELRRKMADGKALRARMSTLEPPSPERIAADLTANQEFIQKVQKFTGAQQGQQTQTPPAAATQAVSAKFSELQTKLGPKWAKAEAAIRSMAERGKATSDPQELQAIQNAMLLYITSLENGMEP